MNVALNRLQVELRARIFRRLAVGAKALPSYCRYLALVFIAAIAGCEEKSKPATASGSSGSNSGKAAASVTLRITVAEDAALGEAIERLRGEWQELSGSEFEVGHIQAAELLAGQIVSGEELPPADLWIFASRHLGQLCEEGRLRPMRKSALQSDVLELDDVVSCVREQSMNYGGLPMALPIGCPVPLMVSNPIDERTAAATWNDLPQNLVGNVLTLEPEPRSWAYLLLARAACYAEHPSRDAILFDPDSMKPRFDSPPFLRAMTELQGMASKDRRITAAANAAFPKQGGLPTILWPLREAGNTTPELARRAETVTVSPLPGTETVWNPIAGDWEEVTRSPQRVTLLGTCGRVVSVSSKSRNAAAAFRLAAWLAGKQNARQLSQASSNVAASRSSLLITGDDWIGYGFPGFGQAVSRAMGESLANRRTFVIPRIVRVDAYLEALGSAVRGVVGKSATPEEALRTAADDWEKLTDQVGRDRQRGAYLRHLGLEEYEPANR